MWKLFNISPLAAGAIVWAGVLPYVILQGALAPGTLMSIASIVAILVYVGLPALIIRKLNPSGAGLRSSTIVWAIFVVTIIAHAAIVPVLADINRDLPLWTSMATLTALIAILGPIYLFWCAAHSIVRTEEQGRTHWDRVVGTFLLFFFLPVGIFLLQPRLGRLADLQSDGR